MAQLSDLKLAYRIFMRAYPYRRIDWRPGAVLAKPLREARICCITTAAFFAPGQLPFDASIRGGDCSYRAIPADTALDTLEIAHRSDAFDHSGIEADRNIGLPLDRLRSLAAEGVIGSIAPRHFSFMGAISAPGRLIARSAPEVVRELLGEAVDAVLLTPV
jgi:D-proline reductase (dithiol) PrdB